MPVRKPTAKATMMPRPVSIQRATRRGAAAIGTTYSVLSLERRLGLQEIDFQISPNQGAHHRGTGRIEFQGRGARLRRVRSALQRLGLDAVALELLQDVARTLEDRRHRALVRLQ